MHLLIIFGVPGAVGAFYIYTQHRERMEAIRRGERIYRIPSPPKAGNGALGFGLVLAAIGLGLLLPGLGLWDRVDRDMVTGGLLLVFGGAALLFYWRITAEDRRKARALYEKRLEIYLQGTQKHDVQASEQTADVTVTARPESAVQSGEL